MVTEGHEAEEYPVYGEDDLQALALSVDLARTLLRQLAMQHPYLREEGQLDIL